MLERFDLKPESLSMRYSSPWKEEQRHSGRSSDRAAERHLISKSNLITVGGNRRTPRETLSSGSKLNIFDISDYTHTHTNVHTPSHAVLTLMGSKKKDIVGSREVTNGPVR